MSQLHRARLGKHLTPYLVNWQGRKSKASTMRFQCPSYRHLRLNGLGLGPANKLIWPASNTCMNIGSPQKYVTIWSTGHNNVEAHSSSVLVQLACVVLILLLLLLFQCTANKLYCHLHLFMYIFMYNQISTCKISKVLILVVLIATVVVATECILKA